MCTNCHTNKNPNISWLVALLPLYMNLFYQPKQHINTWLMLGKSHMDIISMSNEKRFEKADITDTLIIIKFNVMKTVWGCTIGDWRYRRKGWYDKRKNCRPLCQRTKHIFHCRTSWESCQRWTKTRMLMMKKARMMLAGYKYARVGTWKLHEWSHWCPKQSSYGCPP